MKKLVFYISDVGWGHATRQIPLIEEALKAGFEVYLRNSSAKEILQKYFCDDKFFISSSPLKNDPGWPSHYPFDEKELRTLIDEWLSDLEGWIQHELSFLKNVKPDLIISDAVVGAFYICEKLSLPCVFISNFNWYDEYRYILGNWERLEVFKELYLKASHVFLLPFESENTIFRLFERTPLLVRRMDSERIRFIRRSLMEAFRPEIIASFTLGGFYKGEIFIDKISNILMDLSSCAKILWLVPHYFKPSKGFLCYPVKDLDFNNFIAASDFVFSKCGYGVVSEAVKAHIPGFYLYREQVLEDICISREVMLSRWGECLPLEKDANFDLAFLFNMERIPLSKRLKEDGASYIISRIMELFF